MTEYTPELRCTQCGNTVPPTAWRCETCAIHHPGDIDAGLIEITNPLPFAADAVNSAEWSLWRYAAMLPFERRVSLGEGMTPLVPTSLTINRTTYTINAKLDFLQPTSSYKDRGTVGVINWLAAHAVERVVETSSGNAGASVAAYAAAAGMQAHIYVPQNAQESKVNMIAAYGAVPVRVPGSKRDVMTMTLTAINNRTAFASHSYSPFFAAGMMTLAWELWEQVGRRAPEVIVTPVGMGLLLLGMARGFTALREAGVIDRMPRLFAVQAAASDPLVRAWEAGYDHVPPLSSVQPTVADGIVIPAPLRGAEMLRALRESGGAALRVNEDSILPAQQALARRGIFAEPTSATTVAVLPQVRALVGAEAQITLVLTGNGLKTRTTA